MFVNVIFVNLGQCIFCKRFVGVAVKDFPKPCFINNLSNIANLNNFPIWSDSINPSLRGLFKGSFFEVYPLSKTR